MEIVKVAAIKEIPDRTVLVCLEPHGLGTMHVESLSSYFLRLADQHDVSPKLLAREFVLPRLGVNNRVGEAQADGYWKSSFFSGMGVVPEQWCKILEELTGVAGLRRLTLLPLHGLVGMHGSASSIRRWCPHCIVESEAQGRPFGQLLWEIGCVEACPKHEVRLVSGHGCGVEETIRPLRIKHLPHLCWSCGTRLSLVVDQCISAATGTQIRFARVIGELLAGPLFDAGPRESGRTIADFLTDAVQTVEGGYANKAVKRVGAAKSDISGWMNGRHLPSLPQAEMIASSYGVQLSEALIGRGGARPFRHPELAKPRRVTYTPFVWRHGLLNIESRRQELLTYPTPLSEAVAAKMLGTSARELRRLNPEFCAALTHRRLEWIKAESERHRDERLLVVRELVSQMVSEGTIPTIARLEERLVGIPKAFLFKERTACKQICEAGKSHLGV
ncbi:MAG TPA: TniQ family protein [Holophagaceae bacterium]|nr:TniQ family protein [Holophagaceae bacterium]